MQFEVGRSGKFNEFLTTFLKCLSRDRIEYVENWYAEQSDQTEDAEIDGWTVQRRCPHRVAEGQHLLSDAADPEQLECACLHSQGTGLRRRM